MENLGTTADPTADRQSEPLGSTFAAGVDRLSDPDVPPLFGSPTEGRETMMIQTDSSEGDPTASLVGSLSVFTLSDVLTMLASTTQTGELQVVGDVADGRVWLEGGELSNAQVGEATTIGEVTEGWHSGVIACPELTTAASRKRLASNAQETSRERTNKRPPWVWLCDNTCRDHGQVSVIRRREFPSLGRPPFSSCKYV